MTRDARDLMLPPITGILETSLYVADLARARQFYVSLFGFEPMLEDERMCGLSVAGRQVLLLFRRGGSDQPNAVPGGGIVPPHDGAGQLHLAFSIPPDALEAWRDRLGHAGIPIESTVRAPRGGTSLYFRDPDGHLIELATPGLWPIE
jgi:catechol 2,3-dioxygenase-like lactoylglutathione lyase family enzyme